MRPMLACTVEVRICHAQNEPGGRRTSVDERGMVCIVYCEEWAEVTCNGDLADK